MANRLGEDLTGRAVIIDANEMKQDYADDPARRLFVVSGGFGAKPYTSGGACFGVFLFDGEQCRIEGWMVERYATDGEIEAAKAIRQGTPTCQICGGLIQGQPYYWDGNPRLPMHQDMTQCQEPNPQAFCDFMNRNVDYINGRGEPVLLGEGAK